MKITDISVQAKNKDRVNISVDGKYRFSLDIFQVGELGIRSGMEVTEEQIARWEEESAFGKLYARTLEYTMIRPHSAREIRDYLWRKTLTRRVQKPSRPSRKLHKGEAVESTKREVVEKPGVSQDIANRVYARLEEKGYINDESFARWWVETRHQIKGVSQRKLIAELRTKGVATDIINETIQKSTREEKRELEKVIAKKRAKYTGDEQKLIAYLARQGFAYDDIRDALSDDAV